MTKKKWALLILLIGLLLGYYKLFYKTYSVAVVPKSADCIVAVDVKRVTNTVLWSILTSPGQWKKISFSGSAETSWKDMVKIPDYLFAFHATGQPANAWYVLLEVKDKTDFNRGLDYYHFKKQYDFNRMQVYVSTEDGLCMLLNGDRVLLGSIAAAADHCIEKVATELFLNKEYVARSTLQNNTAAKSHFTVQLLRSDFLQEPAVIKANFNKHRISIEGLLNFKRGFSFAETAFKFPVNSLASIGFTQPPASVYNLFSDSSKATISSWLNFDLDSVFLPQNKNYTIDLAGIKPGIDSAISYTYDDNFNQVEKIVVNNVWEPSFNFTLTGDAVDHVYGYWSRTGKLEETAAGKLFLPMPFVRSYCSRPNEKQLAVISSNYQPVHSSGSINCICYFNMLLSAIPVTLLKYLPDELVKAISTVGTVELNAKNEGGGVRISGTVNKREDIPLLFNW